ncbi:XylR family transcriptional regulator [Planctomicrobium sp. SH661]|uniref:XylR family transcriptional regulator n=1 Tax=Planctomicrobium sp. SH661 TaxID=3448124 RepID=UPI003F5CAE3E
MKSPPKDIPHVAILIETSRSYSRGLLLGVRKYLALHGPWSVFVELRSLDSEAPRWLSNWRGDGILTRTGTQRMADVIREVNVPTVELRSTRLDHNFPFVGADNEIIGRMMARHLLERGFRQFAIYDLDTEEFFEQRRESFVRTISQSGYSVSILRTPDHRELPADWESHQENLVQWLRQLPKPVGIMACTDQLGFWLLDACRRADIPVPEEVAVVGVEDDETLCEVSVPPMSSMRLNGEKIGFEAAALLEHLMSGGSAPQGPILIPPVGITVRQSSDILAIEDRDLAAAVRMIRQQACLGVTIDDVLRKVPVSRSSLERKFRELLGRSPQAEIIRFRIERVKQLLRETDWTLELIAPRAGFASPQVLCQRFRKHVGMTPGNYREQSRLQ